MNTNLQPTEIDYICQFDPADSLSSSRLRHECGNDVPDYWTAMLSAFLVVCMLAALAICSRQVEDWKSARTIDAQPAVATDAFGVSGQHVF